MVPKLVASDKLPLLQSRASASSKKSPPNLVSTPFTTRSHWNKNSSRRFAQNTDFGLTAIQSKGLPPTWQKRASPIWMISFSQKTERVMERVILRLSPYFYMLAALFLLLALRLNPR